MYEQHIHAYEQLSLPTAGIIMGVVLIVFHLIAIIKPGECMQLLTSAHTATKAGQILLGIDFIWVALLLFDAEWNPLRMDLFEFNNMRGILLILCPIIWFVMSSMCKENLLPRALGMFLLLMAIVPLSAAFLKEPLTRLLIPIWWYPVLTVAMFWVAKPYLFRDWATWLSTHAGVYRVGAWCGLVYGGLILLCAILFW